jgi:hypothetical protein
MAHEAAATANASRRRAERRLHCAGIMRLSSAAFGSLGVLLAACGGTPADEGVGQVIVSTSASPLWDTFYVEFQPVAPAESACTGATVTAGACCVLPPVGPVALPSDPTSTSGGPATEKSAGQVTLLDVTSNTSIGTYQYSDGNYDALPMYSETALWHPGDALRVSATGDQVGAFAVSVPALSPPVVQVPATFSAGQDLTITWEPDPSADTMTITSSNSDTQDGLIVCAAPDAQGTVTVDASLFVAFKPGDRCTGSATREAVLSTQTSAGVVVFKTLGAADFGAAVQ